MYGAIPISNAARPGGPGPSGGPGTVVGRCGQGGQHEYFRVSRAALEAALDQISGVQFDADDAIDLLVAACRGLRQQTTFDHATSCVNDGVPSMVPLLPPEDIWLDGKELPLDVWRLLSFEYDSISSAVASDVSLSDIGKGSLSYAALAFADLMNRVGDREVDLSLVEQDLPHPYKGSLTAATPYKVPLRWLFFEAGCLLTPLASNDFARWYMAVRYVHWLAEQVSELRVRNGFEVKSVDSRYRGLFAEEMAIGVMAVVLSDLFDVDRINNTAELELGVPGEIVADFVCESIANASGERVGIAAESKGSLGQEVGAGRKKHAKDQVRSTMPKIPGMQRLLGLAFSSSIRFENSKKQTVCHVADPPASEGAVEFDVDPVRAWRAAYGRLLRFIGLDYAAQRVRRGLPVRSLRPDVVASEQGEESGTSRARARRRDLLRDAYGADYLLDLGRSVVAVDAGVLKVLATGIDAESVGALEGTLRRRRERFPRHRGQAAERRPGSFIGGMGIGVVDLPAEPQ